MNRLEIKKAVECNANNRECLGVGKCPYATSRGTCRIQEIFKDVDKLLKKDEKSMQSLE